MSAGWAAPLAFALALGAVLALPRPARDVELRKDPHDRRRSVEAPLDRDARSYPRYPWLQDRGAGGARELRASGTLAGAAVDRTLRCDPRGIDACLLELGASTAFGSAPRFAGRCVPDRAGEARLCRADDRSLRIEGPGTALSLAPPLRDSR